MTSNIFGYEAPFLRASLKQLKSYLLSEEIFWNLGLRAAKQQPPYPQLSLANVLLAQARLQAAAQADLLSEQENSQLGHLDGQLEKMRENWQTAWSAKADKEFALRLRQWSRFLDDLSASTSGQGGAFLGGLRIRTLLQLLPAHLPPESSSLQAELALLDQRYRRLTVPGDFVWQPDLIAFFSKEAFPFLYANPKQK